MFAVCSLLEFWSGLGIDRSWFNQTYFKLESIMTLLKMSFVVLELFKTHKLGQHVHVKPHTCRLVSGVGA